MKVSDAGEGPSVGELMRQIEAGELSTDEAAELLDTMISDVDGAPAGDQYTQLDMLLDQVRASAVAMALTTAEASGIGRIAEMVSEIAGAGQAARAVMEASRIGRIAEMARELAELGRRGRRTAADLLEAVADRIEARRPGSTLPWWLRCIAGLARSNRSTWPPVRQARAGSQRRPDYLTAQAPPGRCVSSSPRKVRGPNPRTDVLVHPRVAAA